MAFSLNETYVPAAQNLGHVFDDEQFTQRFRDFTERFRDPEQGYIYYNAPHRVALEHLSEYDYEMFDAFLKHPRRAFQAFYRVGPTSIYAKFSYAALAPSSINSQHINSVQTIRGASLTSFPPRPRCVQLFALCRSCRHQLVLAVENEVIYLPVSCYRVRNQGEENLCGKAPYILDPKRCKYVDQQVLRIADIAEGSNREQAIQAVLEGHNVDLELVAGEKVLLTGLIQPVRNYFKMTVFGVRKLTLQEVHAYNFSQQQIQQFKLISQDFDQICNSVAPHLYGLADIKTAIACMLVSGQISTNAQDASRLRSEIHILLLADPGVGKSELLKAAAELSRISVLTSGRNASAAGLTCAAVRDENGDFRLEGGALVVADGGVLAVDEFDKAQLEDITALHEAMEQGTVSVAKAGIVSYLRTRVRVLAAANPVFGRYDELKTAAEQINLPVTISSRFDLIFLMKDLADTEIDNAIAQSIYMKRADQTQASIDHETLRDFFEYCGQRHVRMSQEAEKKLSNYWIQLRKKDSILPVTVRQLEALIRLSESIARLYLKDRITVDDCDRAIRLFESSTADILASDLAQEFSRSTTSAIANAYNLLKQRLVLKRVVLEPDVVRDVAAMGLAESAVAQAIAMMVQNGEIERIRGRQIQRVK